jgi:glutathionyl-hydroquinone reductase
VDDNDKTGEFKRGQSVFRNFISREKGVEFPPEKGRYHLYVSYACPWGTFEVQWRNEVNIYNSTSNVDCTEAEGVGGYHSIYICILAYASKRLALR